jgi:hypothetical protein
MNSDKTAPKADPARHWINGEWISSSTVAKSVSPSTGEVLGQYSAGGRVEATSPFAVFAKVADGRCRYLQFMEDTFATGASFRSGGSWKFRSDPDGKDVVI